MIIWMTRVLVDGKLVRRYAASKEALEERLLEHYGIFSQTPESSSRTLAGLYDDWLQFRIDSKVSLATVKGDQMAWLRIIPLTEEAEKTLALIRAETRSRRGLWDFISVGEYTVSSACSKGHNWTTNANTILL